MTNPAPTRSAAPSYITPEGFATLQEEFQALWVRRGQVTQALAAAAAEGDRSENAEYIYRKKELRELDRRIRYLQRRLPMLRVVRDLPADRSRVYFGAWVTLDDGQGQTHRYRIVGPDELDLAPGHISMDSPLGRALLHKGIDEEIQVQTPAGERHLWLLEVCYQPPVPT